MWRRKNLEKSAKTVIHQRMTFVSPSSRETVWWTSLKGPLHCPLHTPTMLWFMAPWPSIDRPIKCFPNNKISELMARLDWLIYEESLRPKCERIVLAFIGWKALLRSLTKPSEIWLWRWVHDKNLLIHFSPGFCLRFPRFSVFNHYFNHVFHGLQHPNDLLCILCVHISCYHNNKCSLKVL